MDKQMMMWNKQNDFLSNFCKSLNSTWIKSLKETPSWKENLLLEEILTKSVQPMKDEAKDLWQKLAANGSKRSSALPYPLVEAKTSDVAIQIQSSDSIEFPEQSLALV